MENLLILRSHTLKPRRRNKRRMKTRVGLVAVASLEVNMHPDASCRQRKEKMRMWTIMMKNGEASQSQPKDKK
jgi:hypothetical protein